ncbi:MAG: hypothetical protein IPP10_00915 [Candidatus Competibacteraceae bacterium]|nr:hypothetical protein [Candidatus Competibacteraceae bacterium]
MRDERVIQQFNRFARVYQAGTPQHRPRDGGDMLAPMLAIERQAFIKLPARFGRAVIETTPAPSGSDVFQYSRQLALVKTLARC